MLFNSLEFLLFLPIVFLLYWCVFRKLKIQNLFIVIVSYVFYGWWDYRFLFLIFVTTLCSYVSGILIENFENNKKKQKIICTINIILNLLILGIFKYYNFFAENFSLLFQSLGYTPGWVTLNLILPVGISFYTFQALSYTIDIYRKKLSVTHDIVAFFAFISFFPQLVAGPIERATNLLPQFMKPRTFNYYFAVDGMRQILWGFFKKMVVADNCAIVVDNIFEHYHELNGSTLLIGAVLFTFQIYGDFSGYSDIAIGTARLFGISLMRNFDMPYFSRDIAEFWRRWHISLSTWFRDYIYIPLGGSRCSKVKSFRNTMIVFVASGFWHGANWTFIVWGIYHALLFLPLLLLKKNRRYTDMIAKDKLFPTMHELIPLVCTFFLVVIGWIIFRAASISEALFYIQSMFSQSLFKIPEIWGFKPFIFIFFLILVEWLQRSKEHTLQLTGVIKTPYVRWGVYYVLVCVILLFAGEQAKFIYFQF